MPVLKYKDKETGAWVEVGGGGGGVADIPITSEVPTNADVWIDPNVESPEISGGGVAPENVYTKEEVDKKFAAIPLGITMTLVWENPDYSANFDAQTISVDLSGYDMVYVAAKEAAYNDTVLTIPSFCKIGEGAVISRLSNTWTAHYGARQFNVTATGVTFGKYTYGTFQSHKEGTDGCIPLRIYGIKGVQ